MSAQSEVTITVDPPNSSMDSAIDAEDSDEEPSSVQFLQRPKWKRNSDSMDSGDMSDTESQPSSLHLAEMDESPVMQSSQAFNHFNVVSCVADDAELPVQPNLHTIIVDSAPITFIDSVGAEALEQVGHSVVLGCSLYVPTALCVGMESVCSGLFIHTVALFNVVRTYVCNRSMIHKMMRCLCVVYFVCR